MIQIVTDPLVPSHELAEWAIRRLHGEDVHTVADLGPYRAFGILKDGKAVCVVIYTWFRQMSEGNDVRVIIVSEDPSWCLPGVLRELFRYPFEVAGCERMTAVIRDGNERSLRLCLGLGFKREGVLRRAHNGKTNAIILGMLKHECKWLYRGHAAAERKRNGQEIAFRSAAARSGEDHRRAGNGEQRGTDRKRPHKRGKRLRAAGQHNVRTA